MVTEDESVNIRGFEDERRKIEQGFGYSSRDDELESIDRLAELQRNLGREYGDFYVFNRLLDKAASRRELETSGQLALALVTECKTKDYAKKYDARPNLDLAHGFSRTLEFVMRELPESNRRIGIMTDLYDLMLEGEPPRIVREPMRANIVFFDGGEPVKSIDKAYQEGPEQGKAALRSIFRT